PRDHGKFATKGGGASGSGGTVEVKGEGEPQQSGKFKAPQFGLNSPAFHFTGGSWRAPEPPKKLDVSKLKKTGGKKGSNPGGVYEDDSGKQFYVKEGKSADH